ncbi:DUF2310 family Zn-ribbon-containing protein [Schlesneria sp. DSM 10557]|uniref:DUF2310 family Zn-ribbon-containing protein n=1 Tax=Schlesneria sp. DSM 10557 TaxID=3044399 RepID=UPI0035A0DC20
MFLAKIVFGPEPSERQDREELIDAAEWCLELLSRNGHINGPSVMQWCEGRLTSFSSLPRRDSLSPKFFGEFTRASWDLVVSRFGKAPQIEILNAEDSKRFQSWKRSTWLFLYPFDFPEMSGLRIGDSTSPVPLYLLPISEGTREHICFWIRDYQHHYGIWLSGGALENSAYTELTDFQSCLLKTGRELAKEVERATGKETMSFAWSYSEREDDKEARSCPGCGRDWQKTIPSRHRDQYTLFDCVCRRCRLVR